MAERKSTTGALRLTAIHEAGHTVAAYYLNVRIEHVTIVPAKDYRGRLKHTAVRFGRHGLFDDSVRGTDRAERHIMVCYAGELAQRKLAPRSKWHIGGSDDNQRAMDLFWHIASADEKTRNLHLALLWRRTEVLVEVRWKDIQAVAAALLKHGTLDADEVAVTIAEANGLRPFTLKQPATAAAEA